MYFPSDVHSFCKRQRFLFCLSPYLFSEWHIVPQLCIQIKQSRVHSRKALAGCKASRRLGKQIRGLSRFLSKSTLQQFLSKSHPIAGFAIQHPLPTKMAKSLSAPHNPYNSPFPQSLSTPHVNKHSHPLAVFLPSPIVQTPPPCLLWHILDCTCHRNTPSACLSRSVCTWISSVAGTSMLPPGIFQRQATSRYSCSLPTSAARCYNSPNPHFFC